MTSKPDWHKIADRLAGRLANHAFCATHVPPGSDPENCPFCDDVAAYEEYRRAGGDIVPARLKGAKSVSLDELSRRHD